MGGMKKTYKEVNTAPKDEKPSSAPLPSVGYPSEVVEIVGRSGVFGEISQVLCKVMDGKDRGRVIRRNVKGAIRRGDYLLLSETETEAKPIKSKKPKKKLGFGRQF